MIIPSNVPRMGRQTISTQATPRRLGRTRPRVQARQGVDQDGDRSDTPDEEGGTRIAPTLAASTPARITEGAETTARMRTTSASAITRVEGSSRTATRTGERPQTDSPVSQGGGTTKPGIAAASFQPIYLNTFPADFPIETHSVVESESAGRGYVFVKDSAVADSMLVFMTFFASLLAITIVLIKSTHLLSRSAEGKGKVDNVIGEDTKWAEGREVVERKIIWEGKPGKRTERVRGSKLRRG